MNHLLNQSQHKKNLKQALRNYIQTIQEQQLDNRQQIIQKLRLRIHLIDSYHQMTELRLIHLQQLFKHYCTHIFRVGSHMTFDRLQYQRVHITMDRFFLFLKDFQLTCMIVNGKSAQILDKNTIILLFKKISSNCKDLNFQQFIKCIEGLAILYYDQKQNYFIKKQKKKLERDKKRQEYQKKKKIKITKEKQQQNNQKQKQNEQDQQLKQQNLQSMGQVHQNDQIKLKNQQKILKEDNKCQKVVENEQKNDQRHNQNNSQMLLNLTNDEKIQYYFKIMKIDNTNQYRIKMAELNLPMFQKYHKVNENIKQLKNKNEVQQFKPDEYKNLEKGQKILTLREKLFEKRNTRNTTTFQKPKYDQSLIMKAQERRKKIEEMRERNKQAKLNKGNSDAVLQKKKKQLNNKKVTQISQKQLQFNEKEVTWNIMRIPLEKLKIKKINPYKLFNQQQQDKIFLQEYAIDLVKPKVQYKKNYPQKQYRSVVQGTKKRALQIEQAQKKIQKNLEKITKKIGQNQVIRDKF